MFKFFTFLFQGGYLEGQVWFSDELLKQPFCLKIALIADSERVRTRADSCELVKARIHPNMLYITRHVEICCSITPIQIEI
jgi:hypothetical protein